MPTSPEGSFLDVIERTTGTTVTFYAGGTISRWAERLAARLSMEILQKDFLPGFGAFLQSGKGRPAGGEGPDRGVKRRRPLPASTDAIEPPSAIPPRLRQAAKLNHLNRREPVKPVRMKP
jgi:hypothetical protein